MREVGQRAQHPVLQHRQLTLLGGLLEQAEHDPGHQDLGNKNHVKALSELKHLLFLIKILNMGDKLVQGCSSCSSTQNERQ